MKFRSLQLKLVTIFGLCLLIAIGTGVMYGIISTKNTRDFITKSSSTYANETAKELLREKANAIGYYIEVELEVALDTARTLADMLSGIKDPDVNLNIDRDRINGILRSIVEKNDTFLGAYTLWEPNALDGLDELYAGTEGHDQTGRFIPYWSRSEDGTIKLEPLVDYENQETHENGVRKGEYYLLPHERKKECAIDPYPYSVQGEIVWLTSLVVPIMVDDTIYGIAGVDTHLSFIQTLVEQANKEFYAGAGRIGIVSHNGILAAVSSKPELVGKHLRHWMPEDWQEDAELVHSGKEKFEMEGNNFEIFIPLKIGRTGMPWAVSIEVPQDAVLAEVQSMADELEKHGIQDMVGQVIVGSGIILIVLVLMWLISRNIARPLKVAAGVADQVSEGDLNAEFDIRSKDEVGQVLKAIRKMIRYIQEVADVAERVSNKDLQVEVRPKSDKDMLNHSLTKMVTNLHSAMEENEKAMAEVEQQNQAMQQQNWLKDGVNQLSAELSGENSLGEVSRKAISFTARYINAGQGVLYVYDPEKERLTLSGSYAFTERDDISNEYKPGEGVIGQVALERAPILLKHPSREESFIKTGTFSGVPLNTYTFPLLYEDDLYGVLELASFESFDNGKQEFLVTANRVIATALFSTAQRERVQALLRRSQEAAEEAERAKLEAQQQAEDARHANVRLEEQQQQLQQQNEEFQQMNAQLQEQQQQLRRTEQVLKESEARIRTIVETAVDGIITIDAHGIVESFNPAASRIFGYAPEEVIGQNVTILIPSPYRENHNNYIANYLKTGKAKIIGIGREVQGQRKNGTIFPIRLAVSEMNLSGRRMFTGIVHDITELKQAGETLQKLRKGELENRTAKPLADPPGDMS